MGGIGQGVPRYNAPYHVFHEPFVWPNLTRDRRPGEQLSMPQRSRHQERIIKNYYENREAISLQRVQELVTELYLSEGKARERHWKNLASHLEKLGVAPATIDHLLAQQDLERIAQLVEDLAKKA